MPVAAYQQQAQWFVELTDHPDLLTVQALFLIYTEHFSVFQLIVLILHIKTSLSFFCLVISSVLISFVSSRCRQLFSAISCDQPSAHSLLSIKQQTHILSC